MRVHEVQEKLRRVIAEQLDVEVHIRADREAIVDELDAAVNRGRWEDVVALSTLLRRST